MLYNLNFPDNVVDNIKPLCRTIKITGDQQTKSRCGYRSAQENFGYQGLLEENLDPTAPADIKETFTMRSFVLGI